MAVAFCPRFTLDLFDSDEPATTVKVSLRAAATACVGWVESGREQYDSGR